VPEASTKMAGKSLVPIPKKGMNAADERRVKIVARHHGIPKVDYLDSNSYLFGIMDRMVPREFS
jgi:hypothetical protein